MEASGISGMKAELNGAPNFSILDGWWPEGFNGRNGWAFGGETIEETGLMLMRKLSIGFRRTGGSTLLPDFR